MPAAASSAPAPANRMLAFSQCMRAHGLSDFPDTDAQGGIAIHGGSGQRSQPKLLDVPVRPEGVPEVRARPGRPVAGPTGPSTRPRPCLKFAACMRSHGIADFPDPNAQASLRAPLEQVTQPPESPVPGGPEGMRQRPARAPGRRRGGHRRAGDRPNELRPRPLWATAIFPGSDGDPTRRPRWRRGLVAGGCFGRRSTAWPCDHRSLRGIGDTGRRGVGQRVPDVAGHGAAPAPVLSGGGECHTRLRRQLQSITDQAQGTVTSLPSVGQVVESGPDPLRGERGTGRPPLRGGDPGLPVALEGSPTAETGSDVQQLNADLIALGYGPRQPS